MLRRTFLFTAGLFTAGLAAPLCIARRTWAQRSLVPDPTPRLPPQPGQGPPVEDVRSLRRAARLSDAQVEAGRLAAERATNTEVKQLAAGISEDHARLRRTVGELAAARRMELQDQEPDGAEVRPPVTLREATGEAFDRAFLDWQLGLYRPMAELYQTMASNSPDPALARLGITALAGVRSRHQTARALGLRQGLRVDAVGSPPQY